MRTKHLWSILTLCLGVLSLTSCLDNDEEGRKVTDYKEWVLTVASKKVPGIVMHRGSYHAVEVYAVKKGPANEWSTYENIAGFEYEEGYEYQVKVSETTYLDDAMGDPSWTEHQLLEIITQNKKESEHLPLHLVPASYYKHIPLPAYRYVVEAENKSQIEEDLKTNTLFPLEGHYLYYSCNGGFLKWIGIQDESRVWGPYLVKNKPKKPEELPESYQLLPPEGHIQFGGNEWTFLDELGNPVNLLTFDVFIGQGIPTKTSAPTPKTFFFYKDMTQHFQHKYPEAGVKTVVVAYTLWTTPIRRE